MTELAYVSMQIRAQSFRVLEMLTAMAAIYSFFVSIFVYKDLKMKDVPKVLLTSANMSAMSLSCRST